MASDAIDVNKHQTRAAFEAAMADYFVTLKTDRDEKGNLRQAYPTSAIPSRVTAGYGNAVDNALINLLLSGAMVSENAITHGATLDGATDDTAAIQAAITTMSEAGGGFVIVPVGTPTISALTRPSGVRLLHLCVGSPESARLGIVGDLALRLDGTDPLYQKASGTGTTGWSNALAATPVYRESFGFDLSTSVDQRYASFTSSFIDTPGASDPQIYNLWRAPFAGSITRVSLLTESDGGASLSCRWYTSEGLAGDALSTAQVDTSTSYDLGGSTGYQSEYVFSDAVVTEGGLYTLTVDPVSTAGYAAGWLELTPS